MSELDIAVQNCKVAMVRYRLVNNGRTVRDDMEKQQKKSWENMAKKHVIVDKNIRY